MTTLAARIALVTGASRGIGAATAIALARLGAHVVLIARTQGGLEATDDAIRAAGGSATLLPLDLAKPESLDAVGPSLVARFGRLDILVHNAGALGRLTPAGHITPKDMATCLDVNFNAAYRLIRTCGPVLAASDAGRAVFVTSSVARQPRAYWGAYAASKAAMEMLVRCWADEVENTPLRVNLFDPGATATRMRATAFPGEDPRSLPGPEARAAELVGLCLPSFDGHGSLLRAA
jgi:NAD(P)-dependent dehydrogenase (short-subunit alcohol dehydrogenase family)